MTYETYSDSGPRDYTGSISQANIKDVPSNPHHPNADDSVFPQRYNQFINKTSARDDDVVLVTDELHTLSDVFITSGGGTAGYSYLNHRPFNTSSFNVSDGVLSTGSTNLTEGVIYWSVLPTGSWTIAYFAAPDAVWADHINAMQNAIMDHERVLGAGSNTGEGIRNTEFWVDSLPPSLQESLPHAINVRALNKDLRIASAAGNTGHTITIGRSDDSVTFDVGTFKVTNTDPSLSVTGQVGDSAEDVWTIKGGIHLDTDGSTLLGTEFGPNVVLAVGDQAATIATGIAASATGYPNPHEESVIARFYGDIDVQGTVWVAGDFVVVNSNSGEQINVIQDTLAVGNDLRVTGNTILGANTSTNTNVNGTLEVGRSFHVKSLGFDVSRIDGPVDLYNPGNVNNGLGGPYSDTVVPRKTEHFPDQPFHKAKVTRNAPTTVSDLSVNRNSTIDGLDPSYLSKLLTYRSFDRHEWAYDCINEGPRSGLYGSVERVSNPATSVFDATGLPWPAEVETRWDGEGWGSVSTGVGNNAFRWYHMGGDYYHGKFQNEYITLTGQEFSGSIRHGDGYEWICLWTQDDQSANINVGAYKHGARIPVTKIEPTYFTGSPYTATGAQVQLSRPFNTPISVGDSFMIYHPVASEPYILRKQSNTVMQAYASTIEPIIGNIKGIHKIVTIPCDHSIPTNYTGYNFVWLETDSPEIAKTQYIPGDILESPGHITVTQEYKPTDSRVALGEYYSEDPGGGIIDDTIRTYAYNKRKDTLWFRVQPQHNTWPSNGNDEFSYFTQEGFDLTNTGAIDNNRAPFLSNWQMPDTYIDNTYAYKVRVHHNFGDINRAMRAKFRVYVAPNIGEEHSGHGLSTFREGPDYSLIQELETMTFKGVLGEYLQWEVVHMDPNYTDLVLREIQVIPGAIIGAKSIRDNQRDISLTGLYSTNEFNHDSSVPDRTRAYWWTRIVIE